MRIKFILLLIVIPFIVNYCATEPNEEYEQFIIPVSKITAPDSLSINDILIIKFDGLVGSNGCHSFKRFQVEKKLNEIHFTLWGSRPAYEAVCPTVMVYLDGKEYKTELSNNGIYKIIINQPDNSILVDSVYVK